MTTVRLLAPTAPRLWYRAQLAGLALTAVLLAALLAWPTQALHVLWDMVIPLLPAVFVVNPLLWRNVCPLATLNAVTGNRVGRHVPTMSWMRVGWTFGVVLLFLMVPARRFLFNTNGPALDVTIILVALLAIGVGLVFARRSAFCNTLCPVLPVEKLYGQSPLIEIANARCGDCSVCTPVGCIELAGRKTVAQTTGPMRRSARWLTTSFGIMAASFPGFILGYFTIENGPLSSAGEVYAHVMLYSLASYASVAALVLVFRAPAAIALRLLGAGAVATYYWMAAPALARSYGMPETGLVAVRVGAIVLVAAWLARRPLFPVTTRTVP